MPYLSTIGSRDVPDWINQLGQRAAARAEALSMRPFRPYEGQRLAELTPDLQRAHQNVRRMQHSHEPYLQEARQKIREAQPSYYETYPLYKNAHEDAVVRNLIEDTRRGFADRTLHDISSHFVGHGQHGSSRHRDIALRAQHEMERALGHQVNLARAHGYETGHTFHNADVYKKLRSADHLAHLGTKVQAQTLADINALESIGSREQLLRQEMMDMAYKEYLREHGMPGESLAMLMGALNGMPYGESTYSVQHSPLPAVQRVNTAGQLGGLAAQLLGSGLFGGLGGRR